MLAQFHGASRIKRSSHAEAAEAQRKTKVIRSFGQNEPARLMAGKPATGTAGRQDQRDEVGRHSEVMETQQARKAG